MLDYFEDTYVGRIRANGTRRNARFAPAIWNLNEQVLDDEPRTNNSMEAFNQQLRKNVGAAHPTVWKLIDALKTEVVLAEHRYSTFYNQNYYKLLVNYYRIDSYQAGANVRDRETTYRRLDGHIRNTVLRFDHMTRIEFLTAIARNINLE